VAGLPRGDTNPRPVTEGHQHAIRWYSQPQQEDAPVLSVRLYISGIFSIYILLILFSLAMNEVSKHTAERILTILTHALSFSPES
jgi:hypothetical protein